MTFNRTSLELKQCPVVATEVGLFTFNRTSLELKLS